MENNNEIKKFSMENVIKFERKTRFKFECKIKYWSATGSPSQILRPILVALLW